MHPMAVLNELHLDGLAGRTTRSALPNAPVQPYRERSHRLTRFAARVGALLSHHPRARRSSAARVRPVTRFAGLNVRNHGRIGACPE